MNAPSCSAADISARLVIADADKLTLEFYDRQNFYRALEKLENEGRRFFVVER